MAGRSSEPRGSTPSSERTCPFGSPYATSACPQPHRRHRCGLQRGRFDSVRCGCGAGDQRLDSCGSSVDGESGPVSIRAGPSGVPGRPLPPGGTGASGRTARFGLFQRARNSSPERARTGKPPRGAAGHSVNRMRPGAAGKGVRTASRSPGGTRKPYVSLPRGHPRSGSRLENPQGPQASFRVAGPSHHARRGPSLDSRGKRPVPNAGTPQAGPHPGKPATEKGPTLSGPFRRQIRRDKAHPSNVHKVGCCHVP